MDVREKLVELIDDFIHNVDLTHWYSEELDEKLADELIAHGVTVQEWIPVKDRLPEDNEVVLVTVCDGCDTYSSTDFIVKNGGWQNNKGVYKLTHWQPLPQPPKGD